MAYVPKSLSTDSSCLFFYSVCYSGKILWYISLFTNNSYSSVHETDQQRGTALGVGNEPVGTRDDLCKKTEETLRTERIYD